MDEDQVAAREVLEALRAGTVPRHRVSAYTVGRERYLSALADDLPFIEKGGYKVRLIVGDWGYGKTHLLALFAAAALARGFAVSHVELHSREAPLEKTETITSAIIRNTVFPGGGGLETHLQRWGSESELETRADIETWLQQTAPSLEFRAILREVLGSGGSRAVTRGPVSDGVRWLGGGDPTQGLTRSTGIRGAMKARVGAEVLTSYVRFVTASGLAGLVLLLDEAEAITSLTSSSRRDDANQTLKRLLDNPEQRSGWQVVFATTRKFMHDDRRGAKSYPALWERIRTSGPSGFFNPHGTVLELNPLTPAELVELGTHIERMHGVAYGWQPKLDAQDFTMIANRVFGDSPHQPPRRFVRATVAMFDVMQVNPEISASTVLASLPGSGDPDE